MQQGQGHMVNITYLRIHQSVTPVLPVPVMEHCVVIWEYEALPDLWGEGQGRELVEWLTGIPGRLHRNDVSACAERQFLM